MNGKIWRPEVITPRQTTSMENQIRTKELERGSIEREVITKSISKN